MTARFKVNSAKYVQDSLKMSPIQNFEKDIRVTDDFQVAAWVIPHPDKAETGGEDTYFISESGNAFGVFDGVGGWAEMGVNSRDFSYQLMSNCKKAADAGALKNPLEILKEGFKVTTSRHIQGSCTACVGVIRKDNSNLFLDALNVGDSGLMVLSPTVSETRHAIEAAPTYEVKLKSKEQTHRFNFPYQLGSEGSDLPEQGDKYSTQLNNGDIVIFGSDGLWDNVYDADMIKFVNQKSTASATEIAQTIAQETFKFSLSEKRLSPFMASAKKLKIAYAANCGKSDDITVLVLKVQKQSKM
jgi:protein phosphatase PTC7